MSSGPAKPLILETEAEQARFDAIAREALNGEQTVVMESVREPGKGGSPTGGSKSEPY